jgi:bis(5'-nucleosidyl)-tetraphosphatase
MFNVFSEFKHTLNYQVKGKPKRVVYWLAELKDPNCPIVLSHEHQKFVWEPLERALEVSGYSDMQKLLKEADNVIKSRKT